MKKFRPFIIVTSVILFSMVGMWLYLSFFSIVTDEDGVIYYLKPGTSKKSLIADLSEKNILPHPIYLRLFIYLQKSALLKTGEYKFPKGSTAFSIWRQVTTGTGLYFHHFTIIPGWSFNQLRYELLQQSELKHIISGLNDKQIMEQLGEQTGTTPEGLFYPETYSYTRGVSDLSILKQAHELMEQKLKMAWDNRAIDLPYKDEYQALIAASLIEKEAYLNVERPIIAGVLINRLKHNMLLQFDPSVIYGLGQRYDGKIHKHNLAQDSEYNTYIHKGLPPTPIAIPSQYSIDAALHPEIHNYFYFVAKGDGSHQFSKSLLDHNKAIAAVDRYSWYFNESKVKNYIHQTIWSHMAWHPATSLAMPREPLIR